MGTIKTTNNFLGKRVCLELKNGRKYFGNLKEIDDTPKQFSWYILDIDRVEMCFNSGEILRLEVLN